MDGNLASITSSLCGSFLFVYDRFGITKVRVCSALLIALVGCATIDRS